MLNGERRAEAPAPAPEQPEAGGRFGLGGLLGRMAGSQDGAAAPAPQPMAAPTPVHQATPEEERIEIPAFLRRQAN